MVDFRKSEKYQKALCELPQELRGVYEERMGLVLQHYDEFDSRYKGLIPLKRVYVPEPLAEPEE